MKFSLSKIALALTLTSVILSGCSSTEEKSGGLTDANGAKGTGVDTAGAGDSALSGSEMGGANDGTNGGANGRYGSAQGGPDGTKTIYFMYDSSQVQEEFVPVIAAHAQSLQSNPSQHIIIEGHADERGSREYNIALGEQRAKAVARMMTIQGASDSQIEVVSYGEEKPAENGHDESAWQLNRRAVIDYQGQ